MRLLLLLLTPFIITVSPVPAQEVEEPSPETTGEAEGTVDEEPVIVEEEAWKPDPAGALWRSGIIAGWGQFYNQKYLKGIILFGLEALTVYGIVYYSDAAAYERRRVMELDVPDDVMSPGLEDLITEREYRQGLHDNYRVDYETHIWLTALILVYSMLDAYVDAHLWDFETGEELADGPEPKGEAGVSIDISPYIFPTPDGGLGAGLSLSLLF